MVDVSAIVVNLNTRSLLGECLRSITQSAVTMEVIVVDNGSTDGSVEMVRNDFPGVRLICNSRNEGFAKPNNDAMKAASGHYYLLMNSDARLFPNSLERLVAFMDEHPAVAMCGPQLLNPDGSIQPSCRGLVSLWTHASDMLGLDRIFPSSQLFAKSEMTFFDHQSTREVDHVMAAVVLIRADAIRAVGMFDEALSIYYNDMDLSVRLKMGGWKTVFYPRAQASHLLRHTTRALDQDLSLFHEQARNNLYYFSKHYGKAGVVFYRVLLFLGFLPRSLYWLLRSLFDSSGNTSRARKYSWLSLMFALGQNASVTKS